jgi:acyl-CoA thioesterase FadM
MVVVDLTARFHVAARYGQELTIHTWIDESGRVKSTWRQLMLRDDEVVATLAITAAMTDLNGRPRRIPEDFTEKMQALL